jgi:20S proteasome subunit alpha 1
MTQLEKQWKKNEGNWGERDTVETSIQVLQTVISSDFKANEIEIAMATKDNPRFRKLTE